MDSKKLGMIAAAALTLLATQANAEGKKAKGEEMVCANSCGVPGEHTCAGYTERAEKNEKACDAAKGKWMAKKDLKALPKKGTEAAPAAPAEKAHQH